jgi:hypothetical protein
MYILAKTPRKSSTRPRIVQKKRGQPGAMKAVGVLLIALLTDCGSDNALTQPQARDTAASAVCDFAARCGNIGPPPATYATRDACLTPWKATIQNLWPVAECTKIQQAEFDVCVSSINNGVCANGLDVLATLSKCGKGSVCGTP